MGRPTKLTPVLKRRLLGLLRKGVPRERAARLAGIGDATFHRWMAQGAEQELGMFRDFRDAVIGAEEGLIEKACSGLANLITGKKVEPSTRLGAIKFFLTHRYSAEWSTRSEVRNTGPDGGPIKVEGTVVPLLSDEALVALTPEQLAATIGALLGGR